jgi:hypothetical protein
LPKAPSYPAAPEPLKAGRDLVDPIDVTEFDQRVRLARKSISAPKLPTPRAAESGDPIDANAFDAQVRELRAAREGSFRDV